MSEPDAWGVLRIDWCCAMPRDSDAAIPAAVCLRSGLCQYRPRNPAWFVIFIRLYLSKRDMVFCNFLRVDGGEGRDSEEWKDRSGIDGRNWIGQRGVLFSKDTEAGLWGLIE